MILILNFIIIEFYLNGNLNRLISVLYVKVIIIMTLLYVYYLIFRYLIIVGLLRFNLEVAKSITFWSIECSAVPTIVWH